MQVKAEVKFLEGDKFDINIPLSNLDLYVDKRKEDHSPSGQTLWNYLYLPWLAV